MFSIALGLGGSSALARLLFCVSPIASSTVQTLKKSLPLPKVALHWVGRCGTSCGSLKLVQQHFCSGHREVDKKSPAFLPPPFLSHTSVVVCNYLTHTDILLNTPPLLRRRLLMDDQRGDGNSDSFPAFSLQSASSPGPKSSEEAREINHHQRAGEPCQVSLAWLGKGHLESA